MEEQILEKVFRPSTRNDQFSDKLVNALSPAHSAKELIEIMVACALEIEFGRSFTLNKGFARMVSTIADSIVTNPELRRQALSVASVYISRKTKNDKR